ncbi:MAG: hypothetical protein PHP42_07670 [Bacteroidota bacterium]|nr:hypothetical protein [Bacteroidota bacterium]
MEKVAKLCFGNDETNQFRFSNAAKNSEYEIAKINKDMAANPLFLRLSISRLMTPIIITVNARRRK